jgi:sulfate transport system ATP-binding protein
VVEDDRLYLGDLEVATSMRGLERGTPAVAYVRHHDVELAPAGSASGFATRVARVHAIGSRVRVELARVDGLGSLEAELSRAAGLPRPGDEVVAVPRRLRAFAEGVELRLAEPVIATPAGH